MKRIVVNILLLLIIFGFTSCKNLINLVSENIDKVDSESKPISHNIWSEILTKHVKESGLVDYMGIIQDSVKFNNYLNTLQSNHPNDKYWDRDEQLAYWINAYNAFTIKLIIANYPIESIKSIKKGIPFVNSIWDEKNIAIENKIYSLNNIEHGILRKTFQESRIHFAINCASISCPNLLNRAYTADNINSQLNQAASIFLLDDTKNQLYSSPILLSKIFSWFKVDFTKNGSEIEYINSIIDNNLASDTDINYLDYNWNLNDVTR